MKSHIKDPKKGDEIWFLEHENVFTLGTAANKDHLLSTKDIPVRLQYSVIDLDRNIIIESFRTKKDAQIYVSELTNRVVLYRRNENALLH